MSATIKPLTAGALRHRVAIDRLNTAQDETTGEMVASWVEVAASVPASIKPISGREFIQAAKVDSRVTARITIRYRPGMKATMRVRHGETIYTIIAILPDPLSGKEWLTLLVESK